MITCTTTSGIRLETVTGPALRDHLPRLAMLRAAVFRDWPYLYEAEPDDEAGYLSPYQTSPRAGLVLAWDGNDVVGAASCLPMTDETADVQAPFLARGLDPAGFFYFGESVLLPAYRGQGIGVGFFQHREAHARAVSDADYACFCAVQRPDDHPARPRDNPTLEAFWMKRGYTRRPDLVCTFAWKDVGDTMQTRKPLMFWLKSLRGKPLP
jgi:GNAT superfamily N-acetyltransferase